MRNPPPGETGRTFKERLVIALGLGVSTYAPENFFEPGYFIEPGLRRQYQKRLAALALQAAQAGELQGRLGLEYAESQIFLDNLSHPENLAYHGSPFNLRVIRPQQASWNDKDLARPRFTDGRPAICASKTTKFPVMRAVLHGGHPEIKDQPLQLRKTRDRNDGVVWFTSEETLETLRAEGTNGVVYAIRLSSEGDEHDPEFDPNREEYRIYGSREPLIRVPVDVEALPADMCIIPSDERDKLPSVRLFDNVYQWGEALTVPVRPLGGLWPREYWPDQ